jgi:hypothetical protein
VWTKYMLMHAQIEVHDRRLLRPKQHVTVYIVHSNAFLMGNHIQMFSEENPWKSSVIWFWSSPHPDYAWPSPRQIPFPCWLGMLPFYHNVKSLNAWQIFRSLNFGKAISGFIYMKTRWDEMRRNFPGTPSRRPLLRLQLINRCLWHTHERFPSLYWHDNKSPNLASGRRHQIWWH